MNFISCFFNYGRFMSLVFPPSTEMKKIYDLTLPLTTDIPVFPGQPPLSLLPWSDLKIHGSATNAFFMVEHTGTHLDVSCSLH